MKISPNLKTFLKSTGITLSLSFIGAFGFYLLSFNFWAVFILFLVFQYIIFSFFGNITNHYISEERRKKELDKLESLSTLLECAYCKKQNIMIFNPDDVDRVEFLCEHCKNKNLVTMQFMVAQISQPLEIPKVIGIPSESLKESQIFKIVLRLNHD